MSIRDISYCEFEVSSLQHDRHITGWIGPVMATACTGTGLTTEMYQM